MSRKKLKQAKANRRPAGVRDDEIIESCGCVFCDLDDVPERINGALKHHYQGRDGRLVPCTKRT